MISLYKFIPLCCPSCGNPTRLDSIDNALSAKYQALELQQRSIFNVLFQLATNTDLLRAATASGGNLIEYYIEDDDEFDSSQIN
jgi:hypothetical protein